MLVQLTIRNVVLIERLVVEFHRGFNVITGETGAGKSIVVDALGLVLGGRATPDIVRTGADAAEVEALFDVPEGSVLARGLEAAGVPCDGELVVRRVVPLEGRSRAYVNGRLCTAAQLTELASELCDIASQHESVSLTDPSTHVEYLDAFGRLDAKRDSVSAEFDALAQLSKELEAAVEKERSRAEREDFLAFQLQEIDDLDPKPGEDAELEQERARLRHAEKLAEATRGAAFRLYEGEAAICDELSKLSADVNHAADIDGSLAPLGRTIDMARSELADVARALSRYAETVESNPARLGEVDERLFRLQKLLRKYGPTTVELLGARASLDEELGSLRDASNRIEILEAERSKKLARVSQLARALSNERRSAAERLADAIGRELAALGMGRARVIVDVAKAEPDVGGLAVDGARLMRSGIDKVEFLIAPNRGEDPRPLRRIASGGELSRALLALKRVLAENGPAGLYVFDEVDAGVGGAIAEVIGRSIADVARHRQVLCITHLPQIAALADAHFVAGKSETKGRTLTSIARLTSKERVDEIARMIGGVKVGDAARRAAAELLADRGVS
jgi:DNA repair protein RecN (Recombination protein N)